MIDRLDATLRSFWRMGLARALGTLGGIGFALLRLPLAWMLGSMCVVTAAAMAGLPVRLPPQFRNVMIVILGVMLGGSFMPGLFDHVGEWAITLAGLFGYIALATGLLFLYFVLVFGYDPLTSYFAASPGGFTEIVMFRPPYSC